MLVATGLWLIAIIGLTLLSAFANAADDRYAWDVKTVTRQMWMEREPILFTEGDFTASDWVFDTREQRLRRKDEVIAMGIVGALSMGVLCPSVPYVIAMIAMGATLFAVRE
ncbi:MAG: hypothetical protein WD872_17645 [Pirellulaceae bacterium]